MADQPNGTFEQWALVELFGHTSIVGLVTEQTIGGCSFLRVDVPEANGNQAFTKFYGNGAVYSMTPVSKDVADGLIQMRRQRPIAVYDMPASLPAKSSEPEGDEVEEIEDDGDDEGEQ